MKRLGVIVNPVAGIGGRAGLKGSDGLDIQLRAREMGTESDSPRRAVAALRAVADARRRIETMTYPNEMGEDEAKECGLSPTVIGSIASGATTAQDTRRAAREMAEMGVDLLLFAGGDGTARDICDAVGRDVTVLGIPAGVKVHSAAFAVNPRRAGVAAMRFLDDEHRGVRDAEVMDIDEEAFRRGAVAARLCGYLRVPEDRSYLQVAKSGGDRSERDALAAIASGFVEQMADDYLYIMGPGTTIGAIMELLGLNNTLLGVDVVRGKGLICADVNERGLLALTRRCESKIVVSIIGGQGYILGRGNQQLSPSVVRRVGKENVVVVATREKLASLGGRPLLVDTGDEALDRSFEGYWRVMTGYREHAVHRVAG